MNQLQGPWVRGTLLADRLIGRSRLWPRHLNFPTEAKPGGETAGVCFGLLSSEGDSRLTDLHKTLASADTTATTVELGLIETQKPAFQFRQLIQRAREQSFSSTR